MTKLCPRGKAAAKRKFKVYPSAYANAYASKICAGKIKDPSGVKRKDFRGPKKAEGGRIYKAGGGLMEATQRLKRQGLKMGGGMTKKRTMMKNGGLKMVTKNGKKVPVFAADGKGAKDLGKAKMMKGGRVKKMGGGISKLNPGLQAFMKKKMKKKM